MKQFDDKASMSIFRIVAILTTLVLIVAGAYIVIDAEGNPFAEKTYVRSEIIISGDWDATEGISVAVMDITHEAVEERYVDQLSLSRPTSVDVDVVIELTAIFENGSEKIIDIEESGYSLTTKWNYTEIIRITMGPIPEEVVEYELFVSVYLDRPGDEPEDTASVSGVLGSA